MCIRDSAYAMLSNVGSNNSEMTAVSLYFYNSVILNPVYADFAQCFHKISIVEMHHLHIFASLSFQMGLDPRLWSCLLYTSNPGQTLISPGRKRPFFIFPRSGRSAFSRQPVGLVRDSGWD